MTIVLWLTHVWRWFFSKRYRRELGEHLRATLAAAPAPCDGREYGRSPDGEKVIEDFGVRELLERMATELRAKGDTSARVFEGTQNVQPGTYVLTLRWDLRPASEMPFARAKSRYVQFNAQKNRLALWIAHERRVTDTYRNFGVSEISGLLVKEPRWISEGHSEEQEVMTAARLEELLRDAMEASQPHLPDFRGGVKNEWMLKSLK